MREQFKLKNEYIELIKLLKVTGLCQTGGMGKMMVEDGAITVDGKIEFRKRNKIRKGSIVKFIFA